jgi:hypothetical protein
MVVQVGHMAAEEGEVITQTLIGVITVGVVVARFVLFGLEDQALPGHSLQLTQETYDGTIYSY